MMIMYANSEFRPAHLPQIRDAAHLPQEMRIFLEWFMKKEVEVESEERDIMQNLGPWLDPTPLLPLIRIVALVRNSQVTLQAYNNTNAVFVARLARPQKQLSITGLWEEVKGPRNPSVIRGSVVATQEIVDQSGNRDRGRFVGSRKRGGTIDAPSENKLA